MKIILFIFFLGLVTTDSFAQTPSGIVVLDVIHVPAGSQKEALYYYENNWGFFRGQAVQRGMIRSYAAVETITDSGDLEIMLMTEFADSAQYQMIEQNFQVVMKELRPDGPVFLNAKRPNEFRRVIKSTTARVLLRP